MQITSEQIGQVVVVTVVGSLDGLTAPDLGQVFDRQIEAGAASMVADLAGLDYTSSAGLRVLLLAAKASRELGGDLRLAAVQGAVNKVLDMAGVTSIFQQFPDVETAVVSFQSEPGGTVAGSHASPAS